MNLFCYVTSHIPLSLPVSPKLKELEGGEAEERM